MHFQHSGAKSRVFEQNTDIIKFWLFYSVTLLNWGNLQTEVSSREIGGDLPHHWLLLKTLHHTCHLPYQVAIHPDKSQIRVKH